MTSCASIKIRSVTEYLKVVRALKEKLASQLPPLPPFLSISYPLYFVDTIAIHPECWSISFGGSETHYYIPWDNEEPMADLWWQKCTKSRGLLQYQLG